MTKINVTESHKAELKRVIHAAKRDGVDTDALWQQADAEYLLEKLQGKWSWVKDGTYDQIWASYGDHKINPHTVIVSGQMHTNIQQELSHQWNIHQSRKRYNVKRRSG